jgi:hypothetical protein
VQSYCVYLLNILCQCAIPVCLGLLDGEDNLRLTTVLFQLAHWHGLAKLRLHTDITLAQLQKATDELGLVMRAFRDETCVKFNTMELPWEQEIWHRRELKSQNQGKAPSQTAGTRKSRALNLFTYKYHSLGDYVQTIRCFGTSDNFSSQIVACVLIFCLSICNDLIDRVNWHIAMSKNIMR